MALPNEMETATRQYFMPVVVNQIFKISPVLYRIFRPAAEGAWGLALPSFDGRSIAEPLEYAEVAGSGQHGAYLKDTTWGAGTTEVLSYANYPWKMYYVGIKIHNADVEANKAGRERIFDIMAVKLRNAVQILRKDLITDFYGDQDDSDTTGKMVGLQAIVAAPTAAPDVVVGGISKVDNSWWRGNVDTAGTNRDLTWSLMNKMFYATKKYGAGDRATLIVGTEGVLQKYEDSLTKTASATPSPLIQLVKVATEGPHTVDGGFDAFFFKRVPMIADPFCPANKLFFINEKYINWRVLKNFDTTGWTQLRSQGKDWVQNVIYGYGALTTSSCRKQGMIEALNEA